MACPLRGSIASAGAANTAGSRGGKGVASYNTSITVYNGSIKGELTRRRVTRSDLVNYTTTGSDPAKGTIKRGSSGSKS
jgi:hypothetical protein